MSPFDSRNAILCARGEEAVDGSRRNEIALDKSAVRSDIVRMNRVSVEVEERGKEFRLFELGIADNDETNFAKPVRNFLSLSLSYSDIVSDAIRRGSFPNKLST